MFPTSPLWWPRAQGQELSDEDRPHGLHPTPLNFTLLWSHRDSGFVKPLQHLLCVPFPEKKKTPCCWCEFTAGGATGDAQLALSVVPFPFGRWDSSSWRVPSLLYCWELLEVILGRWGTAKGPLLSFPATLAWEEQKVILSGPQEMRWLLACVGLAVIVPKPGEQKYQSGFLCVPQGRFILSQSPGLSGGTMFQHPVPPCIVAHGADAEALENSLLIRWAKVGEKKALLIFFPLPNVSCQSFPPG